MILSGVGSTIIGSAETFTLNRSELASIVTDTYYRDMGLWKEVFAVFQNDDNKAHGQRVILAFEKNDTALFKLSPKAKTGNWKLECITIKDFDHGSHTVRVENIPNGELYSVVVTTI